ncbi:prepilin-type N-terminal cleavage/methylation domain-containing protein [Nostoc sp. C052]|uniref:pilus assembly FimT family protein n=1 Tax=Nostoc sp. C052 TaxID=2576902 RepID=UPI0015C2D201|nr:prepilin-type N-terminal cleavage/methylation domain-containing protein [Nostoc sp. C052]QLE44031.1 prepilin-type N-terminal cleavage/methylation domain-containing protein [Nostoc sp. C052]
MYTQVHSRFLANTKNLYDKHSNSGFTLLEVLVVVVLISILATLGISNWLAFVETRRLNAAQNQVHYAMRQAQRQATKEKLTWQASFREQNSIVQWAVHPATVNPSNVNWNNLDSNVRLDEETTLSESNGIKQIQFDYKGSVTKPPLGRITISSKSGGKVKRCVIVSTILGAMRTAKEHTTSSNDKYCY